MTYTASSHHGGDRDALALLFRTVRHVWFKSLPSIKVRKIKLNIIKCNINSIYYIYCASFKIMLLFIKLCKKYEKGVIVQLIEFGIRKISVILFQKYKQHQQNLLRCSGNFQLLFCRIVCNHSLLIYSFMCTIIRLKSSNLKCSQRQYVRFRFKACGKTSC